MRLVLPRPDDWHVHLRQGEHLPLYAKVHGRAFARVLAMPNTNPPLTTVDALLEYRRTAESAAPGLSVIPTFRLMPYMRRDDILALAHANVLAGKYYPDGATTHSEGGITHWRQVEEAIATMQECGIVLCIHGEDPDAPVLEREEAFLPIFKQIRQSYPNLKMVLEHVSSAAGVRMILEDDGPSVASITVQHLLFTLDDLIGALLNPHLFCKPVVKARQDREAIEEVVLQGNPKFFFGSDSAPHAKEGKLSGQCPAGAYTAPMILPALAGFFDKKNRLNLLEPFLCDFGRNFYGLPANTGRVVLERKKWTVPRESEGSIPLMAGQTLDWSVSEVHF